MDPSMFPWKWTYLNSLMALYTLQAVPITLSKWTGWEDSKDSEISIGKFTRRSFGSLTYRPILMPWCGLSPPELLMGRRICTGVPQIKGLFFPRWSRLQNFRMLDQKHKTEQKHYYDCRHWVRPLTPYPHESSVWVDTQRRQVASPIVNMLILIDHIWSIRHLNSS